MTCIAALNRERKEEATSREDERTMDRYMHSGVKTDLAIHLRCAQRICKTDLDLNWCINCVFMWVYVWVCAYLSSGPYNVQKRTLDPTELDSKAAVNHPKWVLGTELQSSKRTACSPSYISLAPNVSF